MFVKLLIFLLLASPLMATDFDTLFHADIEDAAIINTTDLNYNCRNYGAATTIDLFETSEKQRRLLVRFSASGLSNVPDTNAVTDAKLYVKTSFLSIPYYVKIYALLNDRDWAEGVLPGVNLNYGHPGVSWISPSQPAYPDTATGTLPAYFDWRDSNFTTSVKNQGACGSCWAHAIASVVESVHKKDVISWTTTNNSEDGTGADRNSAPMLTPSPEVTATGWENRPIPTWLANQWYGTSGTDNGVVLVPDSGSVKVNTSENASNKPHLIVNCVTRDDAFSAELRLDITSTNLLDSYIQEATPTVNYGGADTALINSSNFMVIRADSFQSIIAAAIAAEGSLANDTFQYAVSCTLQLYMTKYSNATVRAHQLLKNKFIEDSVTWQLYRGTLDWGTDGANLFDQLDLSEQQLLSCIADGDCDNGGSVLSGIEYLRDDDSIMTEAAFRYYGSATADQTACLDTFGTAYATKLKWAWRIPVDSERALKQALLLQPLVVTHAINSNFSSYAYSSSNTCWYGSTGTTGNHAVELIGWDDDYVCDLDGGTGAWIIKNQYGSGWGWDGYAYVSKNGYTDFTGTLAENYSGSNSPVVISLTESIPIWTAPGIVGGSEVAGLVAVTSDIAADGWQAITIPAWVIRAMINGHMSRTILLVAETEPNVANSSGVIFSLTEHATTADRPYLVLKSVPESQFNLKIGNAKIGNAGIGR